MHVITSHKVSCLICAANLLPVNVPLGFILGYVVRSNNNNNMALYRVDPVKPNF